MSGKDPKPASGPCALADTGALPELSGADAVDGWRRRERARLRALRTGIDDARRAAKDARIAAGLDRVLAARAPASVALYWPLPGDPHRRGWSAQAAAGGTRLALPVVTARATPLEFRAWQPGASLGRDSMGIPAPLDGERLEPALVVTPCVGFDEAHYRLGNGGGYYDRTLPTFGRPPVLVGVGYRCCALRTIYPQPHDVPLDLLVTEDGVVPAP